MKKIGKQVFFIETTKNNPRNGEGSFIHLKNGNIMFGYTEYVGNDWNDHANARISAYFSYDDGETWQDKRVLFEKTAGSKNIMSLSFLRMNNGDIGAFYVLKEADGTSKVVLSRSSDEGDTWSEPLNCFEYLPEDNYYVLNNDRVIKLKNGRIIFASSRHNLNRTNGSLASGVVCFFISDDDGVTWRKTDCELVPRYKEDGCRGYQEPGLFEFEDGKLWCYIRCWLGCQFECFSEDFGETWSDEKPNYFFSSPDSPMLIKNVGKFTISIFNPIPRYNTRPASEVWGRTPYVIAVSLDNGKIFSPNNMYYLEDDLENGYCYPAVIETADGFLVAYYHSNGTGVCLNSTKITKIKFDEFEL